MDRSILAGIALIALAAPFGCSIEEDHRDHYLPVTGRVTYNGGPVKMGTIHFVPVDPGNSPASGLIADGEITGVFTRTQGDGIKPGTYKIAITAYDEAFLKSVAKRDASGPDPVEVGRAAENIKKLTPVRDSNSRESGLTAEFSPRTPPLHLELVD